MFFLERGLCVLLHYRPFSANIRKNNAGGFFMDKQALRKEIREKKRAMTETEIVAKSEALGALFLASEAYKQAKRQTDLKQ